MAHLFSFIVLTNRRMRLHVSPKEPSLAPTRRHRKEERKKEDGGKKTGNSFYASTVPFSITIFPSVGFASLPSSLLSLFLPPALSFPFSFGELVVLWVFTLVWWFNMWCNINPSSPCLFIRCIVPAAVKCAAASGVGNNAKCKQPGYMSCFWLAGFFWLYDLSEKTSVPCRLFMSFPERVYCKPRSSG